MRVLVTRASGDAVRTRAALQAAGHEALLSPVIDIVALNATRIGGVVDAVMATSAHAFEVPGSVFGPAPEARRLMPLFLVGERTAESARDHGYTGAATVTASAAALALAFDALTRRPHRLIYLAGRDRKPDAEAALTSASQAVEVLEVYEARSTTAVSPEADEAIRVGAVDAVLHYSRRSAGLFGELAAAQGLDVSHPRHLCLSDDVATPLRERGLPRVEVAEAPNDAALHALLNGS